MSPQGQRFDQGWPWPKVLFQPDFDLWALRGIDERFVSRYVDAEWSVGDYVLSGGNCPP